MSIFINNKYTGWYYAIVANAQARTIVVYTEKHHIIPKSLGGSNKKNNIVSLTPREHFICHRLLTKMTENDNKRKMVFAINMMMVKNTNQFRYQATSRTYNTIKEAFSKVNHFNDPVWQKQNGLKQRGKTVSKATRQKLIQSWTEERKINQSEIARKQMSGNVPWNKGKLCPQLSGTNNGFYGKTHSTEYCENLANQKRGKTTYWDGKKKVCSHCNRELDLGNYARYHGDKCKKNRAGQWSLVI